MRARRGIALVSVLLATTLLLVVVAFVVNVGTQSLRRATEEQWELQAQAGAEGAVGWVRAIIAQHHGDIPGTLADLAAAHNQHTLAIDDDTQVMARVSVQVATAGAANDHLDVSLQQNPYVAETPLQINVTSYVEVGGTAVAARGATALVRVFQQSAPYSEVVGVVDNAGPVGIDSPGDPAGQTGGSMATDLRIHVFVQGANGEPVPADSFVNKNWSDGNSPPSGALP